MRRVPPLLSPMLLVLSMMAICLSSAFASGEDEGEGASSLVHPSSAALKKELTGIVESQLAAFRANDYAKAYSFAASELQTIYSLQDFETMVKGAYPIIAKSSGAEFGMVFDQGEKALVHVRVENTAEKRSAQYRYLFQKEAHGWRITGVFEIKPGGLTV
jgi:hypothetical protein